MPTTGENMEKETLHIINQDDQPYGSRRKCCNDCGLIEDLCDKYVTKFKYFTKEYAKSFGLIRCSDK